MLDISTTCIKKQFHVKAKQVVQGTIKCHHFMCRWFSQEQEIGAVSRDELLAPSRTTATAVVWLGEERSVCHPFISANLVPIMNAE